MQMEFKVVVKENNPIQIAKTPLSTSDFHRYSLIGKVRKMIDKGIEQEQAIQNAISAYELRERCKFSPRQRNRIVNDCYNMLKYIN